MASTRTYTWPAGQQVWFVAAHYLAESGYTDVSTFVDAIRAANPSVLSWSSLDMPPGTVVTIPYLTS